jgi:hypothetical protein
MFGIVALPVAWDHYFLLAGAGLTAMAAGLYGMGRLGRPLAAAGLAVAVAAFAVPTPQWLLERAESIGRPASVALSHYFLGAVLVLGLAAGLMRRWRLDGEEGPP